MLKMNKQMSNVNKLIDVRLKIWILDINMKEWFNIEHHECKDARKPDVKMWENLRKTLQIHITLVEIITWQIHWETWLEYHWLMSLKNTP